MKNLILLFLILFIYEISYAQNRVKPIQLTWDTFKNDKPAASKFDAKTWYYINYVYKGKGVVNDKIKLDFKVVLVLDTVESYFDFSKKHKNSRLLNHEQGHADIGFIYAQKLQDTFQKHIFFKKDYAISIKKIFDSIYNQMLLENQKYDEESMYGTNDVGQSKWDNYLKDIINNFQDASKI